MKFLIVKNAVAGPKGEHMEPGAYPINDKLKLADAQAVCSGGRAYLSDEKPAEKAQGKPAEKPADTKKAK